MLITNRDFFDEPINEVYPGSTRPYGSPLIQNLHGTTRGSNNNNNRKPTPQTAHSAEPFPVRSHALDQTTHEFVNEQMRIWGRGKDASSSKPRQFEQPARMSLRTESPRPAKKSKVFRFIRRPLRMSKKEQAPDITEPSATVPPYETPQSVEKPEVNPELPSSASRVVSRASSKVSKTSKTSKFVEAQDQLQEIPETTVNPAYVPKHAAADFSHMKPSEPSKSSSVDGTRDASAAGPSSESSTHSPAEPVQESNDYQIFLAQARAAARAPARTNSPIVYANNHESQLKRAKSTPQRQRSQRVSGGNAMLEKVGEYVRPAAVKQIQRETSTTAKVADNPNLPGLGFSAVGDTIRRSISTKRKEGYGSSRPRAGSEGGDRLARNRTMPPNAAMQKIKEQKAQKVWPPGY